MCYASSLHARLRLERPASVILLRLASQQMSLTPYHARYFAHELTKRSSSASVDSLTSALADAQVDLNPHQVEAALFAFRSPLSRGAILADEVGLGKTIEAGILLSQRWAERRRHLLVICPANLRKQWGQELADKFFLPSSTLETKTFNEDVSFTNRHALVQEFIPNDDEQRLYALVSEYLQSPRLYALPAGQRQLMTLRYGFPLRRRSRGWPPAP